MRRFITAAVAALTLGGAMAATTAPAQARPYGWNGPGYYGGGYRGGGYHGYRGGYYGGHRGGYYGYRGGHRYYNNNAGVAVAAGIAGLAVGAALASPRSYNGGYYGGGYPSYGYQAYGYPAYDGGYRTCEGSQWVWDPYIGRNVLVRSTYAC